MCLDINVFVYIALIVFYTGSLWFLIDKYRQGKRDHRQDDD